MSQKLSDNVILHFVKIFQEALLTGTDCTDIYRMVELVPNPEQPNQLVLEPEYAKRYDNKIRVLTLEAEALAQQEPKVLLD